MRTKSKHYLTLGGLLAAAAGLYLLHPLAGGVGVAAAGLYVYAKGL